MKQAAAGPRYVCVHGHFYQPPRENPWLEVVERQDSAAPFHDWNERVHAECYGPNAAARILDDEGAIERIVNNYTNISFNFGATLLSWMERLRPEIYDAVVAADRRARELRSGHGSALAQVYGHLILPLANERDQHTQVHWGLSDFEHRFGRPARGMWLSETAVDTASLEVLAAHGVDFTVLAPHQCRRVRSAAATAWSDTSGGSVDTRRPYRVALPSGRSIAVFFYDGPTSRAVAFERLLDDGKGFARRLVSGFDTRSEPQLAHIATDGETYGHHHRFGEMALAYALAAIDAEPSLQLTTYEHFLARHPPTWDAEIVERTSWSCAHGVERWRSDCGCNTGGGPGWSQAWRGPLRDALDGLRDELASVFEVEGARVFRDPWAARNAYIDVVLDRSEGNVRRFLRAHLHDPSGLDTAEGDPAPETSHAVRALELLEMQRHAMLMYTSCGWFFDDLGGLETIQCIRYAARALQLGARVTGESLEAAFLDRLALARSNRTELGNGREVFEAFVRPSIVDLKKVGAHVAASSLFEDYRSRDRVFGFDIDMLDRDTSSAGQARMATGRLRVRSQVTWRTEDLSYAVMHLGDHNLSGGVQTWAGLPSHAQMRADLTGAFARSDLTEVLRAVERHFAGSTFTLRTLFRDEQRKILDEVLGSTLAEVEQDYGQIYAKFAPLMRYLASLGQSVPRSLHQAAEYTLTARSRRELDRGRDVDLLLAQSLAREAREAGVTLGLEELGLAAQRSLEQLLGGLQRDPDDHVAIEVAVGLVAFSRSAALPVDLSVSQNLCYALRETVYAQRTALEALPGSASAHWLNAFRGLGAALRVRID